MSLSAGRPLGRYTIVGSLGAGGMGEVYRAHDPQLRRDVAIKVLPAELSGDPIRLKRLAREATATAALNHPNILAVYDIGVDDGTTFVVSELLEGRTLQHVLSGGPTGAKRALTFAAQIADGLAAAHAKGILHRDVKPANLFVTAGDRIKILDFGLASIQDGSPLADGATATTTLTLTAQGTLLGSAGYMAPEQVRGNPVDQRADIFSLGVVLYEMLSGHRAFHRDTVAGTLAAIVETDPPSWSGDGTAASHNAMRLVRRCLEKSPDDRFQSARDLALLLRDDSRDASVAAPMPSSQRRWTVPAILLVVGALAGGAVVWSRLGRPQEPLRTTPLAFEIAVPENDQWSGGGHVAISNDAVAIAMVVRHDGVQRIGVRRLDDVALQMLPGTEGASQPFFSPDGREVAFFADQQLKAVAIAGGPPRIICRVPEPRGGTWGDDGVIVFAASATSGLSRVPASGGTPQPFTTLVTGESSHRYPHTLPGGRAVLFTVQRGVGVYSVAAQTVGASSHAVLVDGQTPQFARDRLFYVNDHGEWTTVPFDARSLRLTGAPVVQPERGTAGGYLGDSSFAIAADGTLVYLPWEPVQRTLVVASRGGKIEPIPGAPRSFTPPVVSPDGTRFSVAIAAGSTSTDIWIGDLNGGLRPFTHDGVSRWAIWSPAGDRLLFRSRRSGTSDLLSQRPDGADAPVKEYQDAVESLPMSWSADGTWLLDSVSSRPGFESIVAMKRGDKTAMLVPLPVTKTAYGRLSPDGHWLAYTANESGQWEVFLTAFPLAGPTWRVSGAEPGQEPVWAKSGKELFFTRANRTLASVAVGGSGTAPDQPRPVDLGGLTIGSVGAGAPMYDTLPDGRFLVAKTISDIQFVRPFVVVVNRAAAVK